MRRWFVLWLATAALTYAESGYDMWLRYTPQQYNGAIPAVVVVEGSSSLLTSARDELIRGIRGMFGRTLRIETTLPHEPAFVLATLSDLKKQTQQWGGRSQFAGCPSTPDSYCLQTKGLYTIVTAPNPRGVLYGAFALLRKIALGESIAALNEEQTPYAPIRWINQWDNLDGSVERGYGGRSIFWQNGHVRPDLTRVSDYGRLLASIGINACSINSVNANPHAITAEFIPELARIAAAFRPWGVQTVIAVDFASPKTIGGLDTFDPLDPRVAAWWKAKTDELYRAIPDLAGFVMKADSEGRAGPSAYGRTHADAANVVARALKPHGGLLLYRGFVYDHHMDWRNLKNDRARAAYDNFKPLDGDFDDNAVIQIKNGPIDFQVREPASPLFGALHKTNETIELQITQEYMGQARHLVYLVPQWKQVLDFNEQAGSPDTPVKALAAGQPLPGRRVTTGGFVGVANVGLDDNWFGNQLSQANLYGFGRLAWNPDLTAARITHEWVRLTFGPDARVMETLSDMLLRSWRVYEDYTGPLGLQTLTDIVGNHYGVAVEASEHNGWGQWHRADAHGVGMDRTVATGTGFIGQYSNPVARMFDSLATCPDDLLLFMHHVPYTHVLHDGKTVIQYIYDSHYDGAASAEAYIPEWKSLRGRIDEPRYTQVLNQLEYQAGQAAVWRDAVTRWFQRESGIPDARGRVGHYPGRTEAEAMQLDGYNIVDVKPWEAASGGKAVSCPAAQCSASLRFNGAPGWYTVRIEYFDQNNGAARYCLNVNSQLIGGWTADDRLPTRRIDSSSSTRHTITGVALRPGDWIRIEGTPDGSETAALDFIEILAAKTLQ